MLFLKQLSLKKKSVFCIAALSLILLFLGICFFFGDSLRFLYFSNKLFHSELKDNTLALHYTLAYPENYGFEKGARLPRYTETPGSASGSLENSSMSSDRKEILKALSALSHISKDRLNPSDAYTYELLTRYLNTRLTGEEFTYYAEPFAANSGIQSTLPILLADYTFRRKEDVEDYLSLLNQTDEYLSGLLLYETEKAKAGLFMADYSAARVIEACDEIMEPQQLANGTHFLHSTFEERIRALVQDGCISDAEAGQYISENDRLLTTVLAPAYTQIADTFTLLMGKGTNDCGLYYFPEGREYYEYLLASTTGSSRPVAEIKRLLFEDFQKNYRALMNLLAKYPQIADNSSALPWDIRLNDPAIILENLKTRMKDDFPAFPAAEENFQVIVRVKSVSASMEDYSSPAYYLTPPMDDLKNNVIYINRKNTSDNLTLYTTLAHEGYPGHLYQTVYSQLYFNQTNASPLRSLLHYSGFVEGWAYYVENLSYIYAEELAGNDAYAAACMEACRLNRNLHLCLYSLLDIAIHYDGATPEQVQKILLRIGVANPPAVTAVYRYIAQEPVNYLKYYLGYLEIEQLKEKAALIWDTDFTLYRFHKFLLETGPSDFTGLNEQLLKKVS